MMRASCLAVLAFIAASCGAGTIETGSPRVGDTASESPRLLDTGSRGETIDGVIDSVNALVQDFGPGWTLTDSWYIEGSTEVASDCVQWNTLARIDDWGGTTTVWTNGDAELFHSTADLNFGAAAYIEEAAGLPSTCPTLTLDDTSVAVGALDQELEGATGFTLDVYPRFTQETIGLDPEIDTGRTAWVTYAHRFNVVSRLVVSSGEGMGEGEVASLTNRMLAALQDAPTEGSGPISPSPPTPAFEAGTFSDATFILSDPECLNAGRVVIDGITWATNEDAPIEWKGQQTAGRLDVDGTDAVFVSSDGTRIAMTTGGVHAHCSIGSDPDEPSPEFQTFGELSCEPNNIVEERFADSGQDPAMMAQEAAPGTVRVKAEPPFFWWGYDDEDTVIVGVALGDIENADYQVFTCEP